MQPVPRDDPAGREAEAADGEDAGLRSYKGAHRMGSRRPWSSLGGGGPETELVVPPGLSHYAATHGAKFDKRRGKWVVVGTIPSELVNFLPRPAPAERTKLEPPRCPTCGCEMRIVRSRAGEEFWGCSQFRATGCRQSISLEKHLDSLGRPVMPAVVDALAFNPVAGRAPRPSGGSSRNEGPDSEVERSIRDIVERGATILGRDLPVWLRSPKLALGNVSPVSMMSTSEGRRKVLDLLDRIRQYD